MYQLKGPKGAYYDYKIDTTREMLRLLMVALQSPSMLIRDELIDSVMIRFDSIRRSRRDDTPNVLLFSQNKRIERKKEGRSARGEHVS